MDAEEMEQRLDVIGLVLEGGAGETPTKGCSEGRCRLMVDE